MEPTSSTTAVKHDESAADHDESHTGLDDQQQEITESKVRRQLKHMCHKPQRSKVTFYSHESDLSLFKMLRRMATTSLQVC